MSSKRAILLGIVLSRDYNLSISFRTPLLDPHSLKLQVLELDHWLITSSFSELVDIALELWKIGVRNTRQC